MNKRLLVGVAGIAFAGATFGPLPSAVAGHTQPIIQARLSGRTEVPGPGDPDGSGTFTVFGVDNAPDTLCYVLDVDRIMLGTTETVAAHIHEAPPGVAGPVVVTLAPPTDGDSAGCVETPEAQEILTNPADYYVNVHNAEFPGGAVRGQLRPPAR